jgi:hypothetical protein
VCKFVQGSISRTDCLFQTLEHLHERQSINISLNDIRIDLALRANLSAPSLLARGARECAVTYVLQSQLQSRRKMNLCLALWIANSENCVMRCSLRSSYFEFQSSTLRTRKRLLLVVCSLGVFRSCQICRPGGFI